MIATNELPVPGTSTMISHKAFSINGTYETVNGILTTIASYTNIDFESSLNDLTRTLNRLLYPFGEHRYDCG